MRRLTLILGLAALLAIPLAQARPTVAPYSGFYWCASRIGYTYMGNIQLRANGTYTSGRADASRHRFKDVIGSGRFSRSGSRVTFHTGPMRLLYAIVKASSKFGVWAPGERYYSYYCYYSR